MAEPLPPHLDPYVTPAAAKPAAPLQWAPPTDAPAGPAPGSAEAQIDQAFAASQAADPISAEAPVAPAGPGIADQQAAYGEQMSNVVEDPMFALLGARRPGVSVPNTKKRDLQNLADIYYGHEQTGGLPTFEQLMTEMGVDISPPPPFDVNAAADSFVPPMRLESETREEYTARTRAKAQQHIQLARAEHAASEAKYLANSQEWRQMYDEEILNRSRDMSLIAEEGGPNIFEAEVAGHTWRTEAEQTQLSTAAQQMSQSAAELKASAQAIAQNEAARQQRVENEFQAAKVVQDTLRDARQRLEAQPDPDAGRYFKSMSGGQKFLAILGSILTGWNGSAMVPQMLLQLAEKDLEAQKATIGKRQAEVDASATEHAGQMSIYNHILSQVKDERTADLMHLSLQMETAEQMLQAEMARTTVDVHKAAMYQAMVGIKEQQQKLFFELESRIHAMPDRIVVGGGSPYTKEQLAVMKAALTSRATQGAAVSADTAKIPGQAAMKAAEMQHAFDLEDFKAKAKVSAEGKASQDADTDKIDAAIASVDELLSKYATPGGVDFPGQAGSYENPFAGAEAQSVRARLGLTARMIGKAIEDDRFSDADARSYAENLRGDWRTLTDDQLAARLVEGRNILAKLRGRRPAPRTTEAPSDFQED